MDIDKEEFEPIFIDIKERYLSSINFPKLIVGTGLSIAMNIPGMSKLSEKLESYYKMEEILQHIANKAKEILEEK